MKTNLTSLQKNLTLIIILTVTNISFSQLHETNNCVNNFSLDWTAGTNTGNNFNWLPKGSINQSFNNVDNSGIDLNIAFTGDTYALEDWNFFGGPNTPNVDDIATNGNDDILHLFTSGYTDQGITMTITFSEPVFGLGYDMYHVNAGGNNGDKYTITATNTLGETIYPTFTESANPSYTTNNTGVVNANSPSTAGDNAQVGLNFYDENLITSITMHWQDCNTCSNGFVHGSGLGNISFCTPQSLDFDGTNDYISRDAFLEGEEEVTMMSWIKLDNNFSGPAEIMGQRNFRLFLNANNKLRTFAKTDSPVLSSNTTTANSTPSLQTNLWYHVATTYNANEGTLILYLNGEEISRIDNILGNNLRTGNAWNNNHDFEIGRNTFNDNNYFEGSIVEARVYNTALTQQQLQEQVYQSLAQNDNSIKGAVINNTIEGLSWSQLRLYYKLTTVNSRLGITQDYSNVNSPGILHNMRTNQDNNAPLPYIANTNGDWTNTNTWKHGDVWDIDNIKHKDWAIVQLDNNTNVFTTDHHTLLGLLIENNAKLEVKNDMYIENTKYLKVNGILDLQGQSQLIQTSSSILDTASSGFIEIDQQGTADNYTYNYWCSPVSAINTITNNKPETINNILLDGTNAETPLNIAFSSSLSSADGGTTNPISTSAFWMFKFHGPAEDYYSWSHLGSAATMVPGEGYTMKGSGTGAVTEAQNYVFKGKPNNGIIDLNINTGEHYLVGNPYPSALDADAFIRDNISENNGGNNTNNVINGTLYFWEHFGGNSHNTAQYQGGYGVYNLSGGVKAISHPNISQAGIATKTPQRYVAVAQGFFVEAASGGTINFNNGQRTFQKENADSSIFFRTTETANTTATTNSDDRTKLRLEYTAPNGIARELLLTIDEHTTLDYDTAYDGKNSDAVTDDMNWIIEDENYVIQGIPAIEEDTVLPLNLKLSETGSIAIKLLSAMNLPENMTPILKDLETGEEVNLNDATFTANMIEGEFSDRFVLQFKMAETLSVDEFEVTNSATIKIINGTDHIEIVYGDPVNTLQSFELYSILGQQVKQGKLHKDNSLISTSNLATGTYIIKLKTNANYITKKVLIL